MSFSWWFGAPELDAALAADDGPAAVRAAEARGGVARTDDLGWTPLQAAAAKGARAAVAALADAGAPPGAATGAVQWTPAHWAAAYGHADALTALLNAGAAVDPVDIGGWTPLHVAAQRGRVRAAARLLDAGADPAADPGAAGDPETPADVWGCDELCAAEGTWEDAVALSRARLLRGGADPSLRDGNTLTAAELAEDEGHAPTAALLRVAPAPLGGAGAAMPSPTPTELDPGVSPA